MMSLRRREGADKRVMQIYPLIIRVRVVCFHFNFTAIVVCLWKSRRSEGDGDGTDLDKLNINVKALAVCLVKVQVPTLCAHTDFSAHINRCYFRRQTYLTCSQGYGY